MKKDGSEELAECPSSLKVCCFSKAMMPFTIILKQSKGNACLSKSSIDNPINSPEILKTEGTMDNCDQQLQVKAFT